MGVDVQPCQDMKSPINLSTIDLNQSGRVSSGLVLLGGGFPKDVAGRVRGVVLSVDRGIDLSLWLCHVAPSSSTVESLGEQL